MANRSSRLRRAMVIACACCWLVGCTETATEANTVTSNAGGQLAGAPIPAGDLVPTVRVLQLNLCDSGIAHCYTGRSTAAAAAVIRVEIPDLVTVNEICRDDLPTLRQALADVLPGGGAVAAFEAAHDRRTGEEFRCRNGQSYGIGLISRWPSVPGAFAADGIYPNQDVEDPEERAWLCVTVASTPDITACTTHLDDRKQEVATAQCGFLFDTVIARRHEEHGARPAVLGGDLNLGSDDPDLRSCLPPGSAVADDGGVQHVVATSEFVVAGARRIDLLGTTDHPGLLVTLTGHASGPNVPAPSSPTPAP